MKATGGQHPEQSIPCCVVIEDEWRLRCLNLLDRASLVERGAVSDRFRSHGLIWDQPLFATCAESLRGVVEGPVAPLSYLKWSSHKKAREMAKHRMEERLASRQRGSCPSSARGHSLPRSRR